MSDHAHRRGCQASDCIATAQPPLVHTALGGHTLFIVARGSNGSVAAEVAVYLNIQEGGFARQGSVGGDTAFRDAARARVDRLLGDVGIKKANALDSCDVPAVSPTLTSSWPCHRNPAHGWFVLCVEDTASLCVRL